MARRKRKRVGGSYTQKPDDLRDRGPVAPVVTRQLSAEELELHRVERELRHAERTSLRGSERRAS